MRECDFTGQCAHTSFSVTHRSCLTALGQKHDLFQVCVEKQPVFANVPQGTAAFISDCLVCATLHHTKRSGSVQPSLQMRRWAIPFLSCIAFSGLGDMFSTHFSPEEDTTSITGDGWTGGGIFSETALCPALSPLSAVLVRLCDHIIKSSKRSAELIIPHCLRQEQEMN